MNNKSTTSSASAGCNFKNNDVNLEDSAKITNVKACRKPELLAPAGGMDQLQYAIHFGADAVYLATDRFGLRVRASNFSLEELAQAVKLAHENGVQVFVTMNAYMSNDDVNDLPEYLEALGRCNVDAVIMSDLGAIRLARQIIPQVAVHVSTQASCMNFQAANMYYEMGVRRIVCAREMSLAEIKELRQNIPRDMEIEVFVHGAMCMAISGRCLISDHLNARSANKGNCTQPCRWKYRLSEEHRPGKYFPIEQDDTGSFIMSSMDLNMLHYLDQVAAIGVDSIKIEGRVKKAYYVASVVNAYRQVLDGANASLFDPDLDAVSHRPYSTGFYFGEASQAPDGPEYAQTHSLAACVTECLGANERGGYDIAVELKNRFYDGEELEILSPGVPPRKFIAGNIRRLAADGSVAQVHDRADRASSIYVIDVPYKLAALDILRVRKATT